MKERTITTALFDLDGVVFDTESQYTVFWGGQCKLYHPEEEGLEYKIKGQTLVQIFDKYFSGDLEKEQDTIVKRLDDFEKNMTFEYIDGFIDFINDLRSHGVKTAVVTSSNKIKMEVVYKARPEFKSLFDAILTSEDFERSKPDPDCYLKGAARFGAGRDECVVFEDSFNGLKSGKAAEMKVVGLSTTNAEDLIKPYSDCVISDYIGLDYQKLLNKLF